MGTHDSTTPLQEPVSCGAHAAGQAAVSEGTGLVLQAAVAAAASGPRAPGDTWNLTNVLCWHLLGRDPLTGLGLPHP